MSSVQSFTGTLPKVIQRHIERQISLATDEAGLIDPVKLAEVMQTAYFEFELERRRNHRANQVMAEEIGEANADLEAISAKLVLQNDRFGAALNHMSQGLCMFDEAGHLIVSNQKLLGILGLEDSALTVGKSLKDLFAEIARNWTVMPFVE